MSVIYWLLIGAAGTILAAYAISVFNTIANYLNSKNTNTHYFLVEAENNLAAVAMGIIAGPITLIFTAASFVDLRDISKALK